MASVIYDSFYDDVCRGNINPSVDTFYVLLTTSSYTEDKKLHTKRSDVTNEVASGGGYTTGGNAATFTVTKDTVNDRVDISAGGTSWSASTITARKAVYYKHRGGVATADELVCVIDNGADVSTTNGTLTLTASTLRIQN